MRAEPARFADHRPVLQLFGGLVAGREVTLRPLVAGEVIEASPALVESGRVAKGELVVVIDPSITGSRRELAAQRREAAARRTQLQLETEWTMLRPGESQLELARRDLARREQLLGSAAAAEKALDDAQMAVAQHEAALAQRRAIETLEAQLAQRDAVIERLGAAVERAERDLAKTELRAPFAGLVTEVAAALGALILSLGVIFGGRVGFVFFSGSEASAVYANLVMAPGTVRAETEATLAAIDEALHATARDFGADPGELVVMSFVQLGETLSVDPRIRRLSGDNAGAISDSKRTIMLNVAGALARSLITTRLNRTTLLRAPGPGSSPAHSVRSRCARPCPCVGACGRPTQAPGPVGPRLSIG